MFETLLEKKLSEKIIEMSIFSENQICHAIKEKKILEFNFEEYLPERIGEFSLYIDPKKPLKLINGSYIIIDYSDFNTGNSLAIYYNIYSMERRLFYG